VADDERKTLLKFEGDASGAKQAAAETKQALQEVGQKVNESQEKVAGSVDAATAALKGQAGQTAESAETVAGLGEAGKSSAGHLGGLARVVGGLRPLLGGLGQAAGSVVGLLRLLATGAGAMAAAVVGAFALVNRAIEDASARLERFNDAQNRLRQGAIAVETGVAEAMAQRGKAGDKALDVATGMAKKYEAAGFEPSAVRKVASFVVSEAGEVTMPEEKIEAMIAGVQTGRIQLEGYTEAQQKRSVEKAGRTIAREPDWYRRSATATRRPREREAKRAQQEVSEVDIASILEREQGLSPEDAQTTAKDVRELVKTGRVAFETWPGAIVGGVAEELASEVEQISGMKDIIQDLPREARERRAREALMLLQATEKGPTPEGAAPSSQSAGTPTPAMTPIPPASVTAPTPAGGQALVEDPETGEQVDTEELAVRQARRTAGRGLGAVRRGALGFLNRGMGNRESAEDEAFAAAGGVGEGGPTVNVFNHGNIHMGADTRGKRVQRIQNP